MSIKSFDPQPRFNSNSPTYSSGSTPVARYPSSSSPTYSIPRSNPSGGSSFPPLPSLQSSYHSSSSATWSSSGRQWTAPPPMPSPTQYSRSPCLPNLTSNHPSSSSLTPKWTSSSPISGHSSLPTYSQLFTQANPFPQSSPTAAQFSSSREFQTRNFQISSTSQISSLHGNASSASYQSTNLALPQFSLKNSFDDFSFFHRNSSKGGFVSNSAHSGSQSLRSFMDKEMSPSPSRFLPTMEDRAFQTFQKAMNTPSPYSLTTISVRPSSIDKGSLAVDVTSARFSDGVPHISTAKITLLDTAVGIWNGTKQAFALVGLQQMELSGQERMEILNTMIVADQARRTAFKEQLRSAASSEPHPVAIAKDFARHFVSSASHDIFREHAPLFVLLSKCRPNSMFEDISSRNFWDAPQEIGHEAIDNFFQTHLAQTYLAEPLFLTTKCELPLPGNFLSTFSKAASAGTKTLSTLPKLAKKGTLAALPKTALSCERGLVTLPKVALVSEKALASSANHSLIQLEKTIYDVFGKDSRLIYKISEGSGSILKIENIGLDGRQVTRISENFSVNLNRFHQAAQGLSEIGQTNIRILRGWAKSRGWEMLPNPEGRPEIWGLYQDGKFKWHLKIKAEGSLRLGLESGSDIPRFDARLLTDEIGKNYINPFSGKIGNKQVGKHLPLEFNYNK